MFKVESKLGSGSNFQPRLEWVLDITKSEEELLKDLHKNTRYGIRFGEKNDVETKVITSDLSKHFDSFYELMSKTSSRSDFGLHNKEYYKNVFEVVEKNNTGFITVSYLDDKPIAIAFNIIYGDVCMYTYAASDTEHRKLMAPYKIIWESIIHSKSLGIKKFNFGGIAKNTEEKSKLAKLTVFKQKFKGYEYRHTRFYDIVQDSFWYFLYTLYKTFR
jgi:lipid II:glycine glycyltransferase (peptidoglycan interpeptide bridge formation enzyme)